jgi:hypothetical protein
MTAWGQNEKVSARAFLDRCTPESGRSFERGERQLRADFVAEVGDYYARGLPRFVDTSSYYAAFGER